MSKFWNDVWQIIVETNLLNVFGALVILTAGWLIALLIEKLLTRAVRKSGLSRKLAVCLPEEQEDQTKWVEKVLPRIGFWIIFLFTLLGCFSALKLTEAATPIEILLSKVWGFLPNLAAAGLIATVAWLAASGLKYGTQLLLLRLRLDEKIEGICDKEQNDCELSNTIAVSVSLLTYVFFLPAILRALNISGITEPLENMLSKALTYLPNLLAAAAIATAGILAAILLRKLVLNLLSAAENSTGALKIPGGKKIAKPVSAAVYVLVALPVITAALEALQLDVLSGSTGELFSRILNAGGNIFGALLSVFAAWLAGMFAAAAVEQLLASLGFDNLFHKLGFTKKAEEGAENDKTDCCSPSRFAGKLTLAAIVLFGLVCAFQLLGFELMAGLLHDFIPFAGKILLAAVVFLAGIYLSRLAATAFQAQGLETRILQMAVRIVILFFAGALALHCTGIAGPIVENAFTLILGAVAVAAAIAFGLGGREFAARKLAEWETAAKDNSKEEK